MYLETYLTVIILWFADLMFHLQTLLLLLRSQCKGDFFTIFWFLVIPLSEHSELKKWDFSHLKRKIFSGGGPPDPPPHPTFFWTQVKSALGKSLRRRNVFCPIFFWNKVNFTFASFENLSAIMHVKSKRSFNLLKSAGFLSLPGQHSDLSNFMRILCCYFNSFFGKIFSWGET